MRHSSSIAIFVLGAMAAAVGTPGPVLGAVAHPAGSGQVRVVDDDGLAGLTEGGEADCSDGWKNDTYPVPDTVFAKIADAVSKAVAGDRIVVCPGVYNESITVDKTLTIEGPFKGIGAGTCEKRYGQATIIGKADPALYLRAPGIVVDGIRVANSPGGAIRTDAAFAGYRVRNSVLASSAFGVRLASDGSSTSRIVRNCFRDDNNGAPGAAIRIDGALGKAVIYRNTFRGHRAAGVQIASATASDIRIEANASVGEKVFVSVADAQGVTVTGNSVTQEADISSPGSAIAISGSASGVTVERNSIASGHSEAVSVKDHATGVVIDANRITLVYDGISVSTDAAGGVTVTANRLRDIGGTGLLFSDKTNGNTITGNAVRGITRIACNDGSSGAGTGGTANTWTDNVGKVSAPDGICLP